jgi:hypothetical protein
MTNTRMPLVTGRDCGSCAVCCTLLGIDTPEIQKPSRLTCRHCTGSGCGIYETRFPICRDYHCGWRQLPNLDESWRPDRSGVFIELVEHQGPVGRGPLAAILMLTDNPLKAIREPRFLDLVAAWLRRDFPVRLALPGPSGHEGYSILLNTPEMRAAAESARGEMRKGLEAVLNALKHYDFRPLGLVNRGNDVSAAE